MTVLKEFASLSFLFLNAEQRDGMFQESWSKPGQTIQFYGLSCLFSQAISAPQISSGSYFWNQLLLKIL